MGPRRRRSGSVAESARSELRERLEWVENGLARFGTDRGNAAVPSGIKTFDCDSFVTWLVLSNVKARTMIPQVLAVARDGEHRFSKQTVAELNVLAGLGVEGDAHQGVIVKHRSRVAADPTQPNLRQVHLIHSELFHELRIKGFEVEPADLGENVTTAGLDLLGLPRNTLLAIGAKVVLKVTGLRNPCAQIERFRPGLLAAVLDRGPNGEMIRKAGIMTVVRVGGVIRPGDRIEVDLPAPPYLPLGRV